MSETFLFILGICVSRHLIVPTTRLVLEIIKCVPQADKKFATTLLYAVEEDDHQKLCKINWPKCLLARGDGAHGCQRLVPSVFTPEPSSDPLHPTRHPIGRYTETSGHRHLLTAND